MSEQLRGNPSDSAAGARFPWLYLLLAYGWTALWVIPVAVSRRDYQGSPLLLALVFIGIFGPGLAGIYLTYRQDDRAGRDDFWRRATDTHRIHLRWIIFMLVLWPVMHLSANWLSAALGSAPPPSELAGQVARQPLFLVVVVVLYFLQSLLEDLGWRGYMLEKLLHTWRPPMAALLVGIFHAFWHLPFFFVVGTNQMKMGLGLDFWLFVAQAVSFSFYATWSYVGNSHSTLAAIVLHTIGNLCNDFLTLAPGTPKFQIYTAFMIIGALLICLNWLRRAALESRPPQAAM